MTAICRAGIKQQMEPLTKTVKRFQALQEAEVSLQRVRHYITAVWLKFIIAIIKFKCLLVKTEHNYLEINVINKKTK